MFWFPPGVKATFLKPVLQGTIQWANEEMHRRARTETNTDPFLSDRAVVSSYQYWRDLKPSLITINLSKWPLFSALSPHRCCCSSILSSHFISFQVTSTSPSLSLILSFPTAYLHDTPLTPPTHTFLPPVLFLSLNPLLCGFCALTCAHLLLSPLALLPPRWNRSMTKWAPAWWIA